MIAARNGHREAVRALLEAGAEVDHADNDGCTALHAAAEEGHVEVIQTLLKAGADLNLRSHGRTALLFARVRNHLAAAHALVQAGATE